jgi:hypothetical protein
MPSTVEEMEIPKYETFPRSALESQVRDLRADFGQYLDRILGKRRTNALEMRAATFFAERYEDVFHAEGHFSLCDVKDFTSSVGPLPEAAVLDAPPYTEILFQGFRGMAYRHPEYMLARDVEFNYDMFWQTEALVCSRMRDRTHPRWMGHAVENVQSLARATILSCFSLIESTVSGIARAHAMRNADLDANSRKRLLDPHGPLLDRLLTVPQIVTGHPVNMAKDTLPLSKLFGEIKQRRDAFMHCEPGEQESRPGFVKQNRFHDVSAEVVDDAVALTAGCCSHSVAARK